jgi:hypothetical protein
MPVTIDFRENGHIIVKALRDPWDVDQLLSADAQLPRYYDSVRHKVHMLADVRSTNHIPPALIRLARSAPMVHPNAGEIAIVGATALMRAIGHMMFRIARFERVRYFATEEEAMTFLCGVVAQETLR